MFRDLLTQRADLERGTVSNVDGAEQTAWRLALAGVPVLVRQARPPADLRLGVDETVTHVLYCLPLREIADAPQGPWRFVVGGQTYVVVDARDPGGRGHHLEVRVRRLT